MDNLEERVGPEGRKLFEKFREQVNKLQEQQEQEERQRTGSPSGAIGSTIEGSSFLWLVDARGDRRHPHGLGWE